jgi:hypothetical protein
MKNLLRLADPDYADLLERHVVNNIRSVFASLSTTLQELSVTILRLIKSPHPLFA